MNVNISSLNWWITHPVNIDWMRNWEPIDKLAGGKEKGIVLFKMGGCTKEWLSHVTHKWLAFEELLCHCVAPRVDFNKGGQGDVFSYTIFIFYLSEKNISQTQQQSVWRDNPIQCNSATPPSIRDFSTMLLIRRLRQRLTFKSIASRCYCIQRLIDCLFSCWSRWHF